MADAVHDLKQDFWRPASSRRVVVDPVATDAKCECGADYLIGARYCHICGEDRVPNMGLRTSGFTWVEWLDFASIRQKTGFGTVTLVLFVIGVACAIAAACVGMVYTASTLPEWQAVQLWRIQWLLGAAVAFLAAIALKRNPGSAD